MKFEIICNKSFEFGFLSKIWGFIIFVKEIQRGIKDLIIFF